MLPEDVENVTELNFGRVSNKHIKNLSGIENELGVCSYTLINIVQGVFNEVWVIFI